MTKSIKKSNSSGQFLVIARPLNSRSKTLRKESGDRSVGETIKKAGKALAEYVYLDSSELQTELMHFLQQFGDVFTKLPVKIGDYSVDSVEISAEITAKGSVGLLGTGGEAGGSGGLKFTFKRKT